MPMEHVFAVEALALAAGGSTSQVERLFFMRGKRSQNRILLWDFVSEDGAAAGD